MIRQLFCPLADLAGQWIEGKMLSCSGDFAWGQAEVTSETTPFKNRLFVTQSTNTSTIAEKSSSSNRHGYHEADVQLQTTKRWHCQLPFFPG